MATFNKVAKLNVQAGKIDALSKLLFDAEKDEAKFIVRWMEGNLKVGVGEQTIIGALARAVCVTPFNLSFNSPELNQQARVSNTSLEEQTAKAETDIKRAISEHPDYDHIMEALREVGSNTGRLKEICYIHPGIPVKPMLAKPTKGVKIILERFKNTEFTCEYKYDGFRGQIHFTRGAHGPEVHVFSRNLEDMTETYPDVIDFIREIVKDNIQSFIMDSEIVAYDRKTVI
jgi:DNA ligase-1